DLLAFCRGKALEGAFGGRQSSGTCAKYRCPELIQEMQGLFDCTFRKVYTRDRRGAPIADRFKVLHVYRVLNDQVWREYLRHRERLRLLRWNCPPLEQQVPGGPATHAFCESLRRMGRSHMPHLDAQVAECWLFHGTNFQGAASRRRTTSAWTSRAPMRGPSMARASTWRRMSDEYGEGPTGRAGEEEQGERAESHAARAERRPPPNAPLPPLQRNSAMIVCRALLGKVRYSDEEKPSADDIQRTCLGKDPAYDSVLGDRRKIHGTFREFVLYHDDQVYPEFIVVYQRVFFHERFQERSSSTWWSAAGNGSSMVPPRRRREGAEILVGPLCHAPQGPHRQMAVARPAQGHQPTPGERGGRFGRDLPRDQHLRHWAH
ncbi:unnamed protein product, partial [Effrenium voratum]